MKLTFKKPARSLLLAALGLIAAGPTTAYARTVSECYEKVQWDCYLMMKDASFIERVAIGAYCSALLAGCTSEVLR